MCGIFGCICRDESPALELAQKIKYSMGPLLGRRGPDAASAHCIGVGGGMTMHLEGSVLHMRGPLTAQPLVSSNGDALLWNGEVFAGIKTGAYENDTSAVFHALRCASSDDDLLKVLSSIKGPWALIYWQSSTQRLWFGRDVFGRRSLLWHTGDGLYEPFSLTSVACADTALEGKGGQLFWSEVPAVGVFCASMKEMCEGKPSLHCYPWKQCGSLYQDGLYDLLSESVMGGFAVAVVHSDCLTVPFPPLNKDLPDKVIASVCDYVDHLDMVGEQGVVSHDASRHGCSAEDHAYQQQRCVSAVKGQTIPPLMAVNTCEGDGSAGGGGGKECGERHLSTAVLKLPGPVDPSSLLLGLLKQAVDRRVCNLPVPLDVRTAGGGAGTGARVGILFSGGVDSVVMAALADLCLPQEEPIDLINVAFDQGSLPAKQSTIKSVPKGEKSEPSAGTLDHKPDYSVPDRLLALSSVRELNQRRRWHLILVNVEPAEAARAREEHFGHLVHPLRTVLDDSIGCALWFAARGEGLLQCSGLEEGRGGANGPVPCVSSAKALLVGIGADEQLAGYSRHRQRFIHGGWQGLAEEVDMDVKRISSRNLGRDDRCIGDHGRESRFPFLDEDVVSYLQQLRIDLKADLRLPRGVGEKRLLREVATSLGCHVGAAAPKRAIQFGSRVAKVTGSAGEQGSDICSRLK